MGCGVRVHHLEVLRTARYYTLGSPGKAVRETWYVLHGYRQLASRFLRRFEALDDGTRLVVAPEALSRFYADGSPGRHGPESRVGATWMTREDREHEIGDYVRYLDRVRERVRADLPGDGTEVLMGFSQGCHTAARWAVLGSIRPALLVLWGDYLPVDLPPAAARKRLVATRLVVVHGTEDPSLREELTAAHEARLRILGVPCERVLYEGGHDLDGATLLRLAAGAGAAGGAS